MWNKVVQWFECKDFVEGWNLILIFCDIILSFNDEFHQLQRMNQDLAYWGSEDEALV